MQAELQHRESRYLPAKGTVFIVASIAWLLAGIRIELAAVGGSSVRLEDVILLSLVPFAIPKLRLSGSRLSLKMYIVTALMILSAMNASLANRVSPLSSLLYAIRPLEYWVVFAALSSVMRQRDHEDDKQFGDELRGRIGGVLKLVLILQLIVASLQVMAGIDVGFSKFALTRGAGLTAGPYELGAIGVIALAHFAARGDIVWSGVSIACVLLSSSRISIAAVIVVLAYISVHQETWAQMMRRMTPRTSAVLISGLVSVLLLSVNGALGEVVGPLVNRVADTTVAETWRNAGEQAESTDRAETAERYYDLAYRQLDPSDVSSDLDASNGVRFFRWHLLLDTMKSEPSTYFLGLGPSFAGPSVDGTPIRILVESGFFGLLAWSLLFSSMYQSVSRSGRAALLGTFIGSVFIDLPYSMRVSVMLVTVLAISGREGVHGPAT